MTRVAPRWWWLTLTRRPATLATPVTLVVAWALFLGGWIDGAALAAVSLVAIAAGLVVGTAHLYLVVRRALIQLARRWA